MNVVAVIVAGGTSSRMGREKAFELVRGRTIIERITSCLQDQVRKIVINANGDLSRLQDLGLPVIADIRKAGTPLAGLHAALHFADEQGFDTALTLPSDTPFLPGDLAKRLAEARGPAAIAASGGQQHYLTGLWSRELLRGIEDALESPRLPRLQDWAKHCRAGIVEWPAEPYDPFFNVNTPEELAEARRIAAEFSL
jgi:molybdenum cofactor guanylyltransferase